MLRFNHDLLVIYVLAALDNLETFPNNSELATSISKSRKGFISSLIHRNLLSFFITSRGGYHRIGDLDLLLRLCFAAS